MMAYVAAPSRLDDPEGLGRDVIMIFNSTGQIRKFSLPELGRGMEWNLFLDTGAAPPDDIYPNVDGPAPPSNRVIETAHHSLKVYVCSKAPV